MRTLIITSGIPANGKSTIGQALATAFSLPMLNKDEILKVKESETQTGEKHSVMKQM